MTFIPLNHKNFVRNKVESLLKVEYQNTNSETFLYDQNFNSKSLIFSDPIDLRDNVLNLNEDISEIDKFIKRVNTKLVLDFISENLESFNTEEEEYSKDYFDKRDEFIEYENDVLKDNSVINENIKKENFKNEYRINRVEQKFLPDSFELQKKNYIKNRLYGDYKKDYSLDFYSELHYGFCNWNSINFFSQGFDENLYHSNCIIWPNTENDLGNQYNFINNQRFNLSLYMNVRNKKNNSNRAQCFFHVPDLISMYLILDRGSNYKIGILLGDKTRKNIHTIFSYSQLLQPNERIGENFYISSSINVSKSIENNSWHNLSLNYMRNESNNVSLNFYLDGIELFDVEVNEVKEGFTGNSFICLGNKPSYSDDNNYSHVFYEFFAKNFDKDISLGKNNTWQDDGSINANNLETYKGVVSFKNKINDTNKVNQSESFNGEIHDIRIYSNIKNQNFILDNICKKSIKNLETEIANNNLEFYVPVFYVPYYVKKKGSYNASSTKVNLRYSCIFNPFFANSCGGLDISAENYLSDFINHTKPNVIIGGSDTENVSEDFLTVSNATLTDYINDNDDIRKGVLQNTIYNKNLKSTTHSQKVLSINSNSSYRNLLILPNDNGIQEVYFDPINYIINQHLDSNKLDTSLFNSDKNFNITIENIHKNKNYNYSWNLNDSFNNVPDISDISFGENINFNVNNDFKISDEVILDNIDYINSLSLSTRVSLLLAEAPFLIADFDRYRSLLFNYSNLVYHNDQILSLEESFLTPSDEYFDLQENCLNIYKISLSNPIIRRYKEDNSILLSKVNFNSAYLEKLEYSNTEITYFKLPVPYSVINQDYDSIFTTIFDIPSKFYNKKIEKDTFQIEDNNISTSNGNINLKFSDNKRGMLYRDNCNTKVATWNYVGHVFYKDGIVSLNRPESTYFGVDDFKCNFYANSYLYVHEINIPVDKGLFDKSSNSTYNEDLRHDESAFNSEESFVYITDINLHDENLNVVAKAKLARPAPKKPSDSILFRLKMDY